MIEVIASRAAAPEAPLDGCAFADSAKSQDRRPTPAITIDVAAHRSNEDVISCPVLVVSIYLPLAPTICTDLCKRLHGVKGRLLKSGHSTSGTMLGSIPSTAMTAANRAIRT